MAVDASSFDVPFEALADMVKYTQARLVPEVHALYTAGTLDVTAPEGTIHISYALAGGGGGGAAPSSRRSAGWMVSRMWA